jgi:CPA1 family monovalent cation:H+ antiporter
MRGVVSLAAALALPITLSDGRPFPERDLILFLTFCVILATLILQGLSLPYLIRRLGVRDRSDDGAERQARTRIAEVALAHLQSLEERDTIPPAAMEQVAGRYRERLKHLNDPLAEALGWSADRERLVAARRLWREGLNAERRELLRMRRQHEVDHEVGLRLEHELDLEEARLMS